MDELEKELSPEEVADLDADLPPEETPEALQETPLEDQAIEDAAREVASQVPQQTPEVPEIPSPQQATAPQIPIPQPAPIPKDAAGLRDYLINKYGKSDPNGSAKELAGVLKAQTELQRTAALGNLGLDLGSALSYGNAPSTAKAKEAIESQASQPLREYLLKRQLQSQDIDKNAVLTSLAAKQAGMNTGSPLAGQLQQLYAGLAKKSGLKFNGNNLSPDDMKRMDTVLGLQAKLNQADALAKLKSAADQNKSASKAVDKDVKTLDDAVKGLRSDADYKKQKSTVSEAQNANTLIDEAGKNPTARQAVTIFLARFATGGQRINQQELQMLGQSSQQVRMRLTNYLNDLQKGTLTPEAAGYMKKFVTVMGHAAEQNMQRIEETHAGDLARVHGLPEDEALYKLTGRRKEKVPEKAAPQQQQLTPQDQKAIEWAQAHKGDPRAAKILQLHGLQ
jgi:hypothetical protein